MYKDILTNNLYINIQKQYTKNLRSYNIASDLQNAKIQVSFLKRIKTQQWFLPLWLKIYKVLTEI